MPLLASFLHATGEFFREEILFRRLWSGESSVDRVARAKGPESRGPGMGAGGDHSGGRLLTHSCIRWSR